MRLALVVLLALLLAGCAAPAPVSNRVQPTPDAPVPGLVGGTERSAGGLVPHIGAPPTGLP